MARSHHTLAGAPLSIISKSPPSEGHAVWPLHSGFPSSCVPRPFPDATGQLALWAQLCYCRPFRILLWLRPSADKCSPALCQSENVPPRPLLNSTASTQAASAQSLIEFVSVRARSSHQQACCLPQRSILEWSFVCMPLACQPFRASSGRH